MMVANVIQSINPRDRLFAAIRGGNQSIRQACCGLIEAARIIHPSLAFSRRQEILLFSLASPIFGFSFHFPLRPDHPVLT